MDFTVEFLQGFHLKALALLRLANTGGGGFAGGQRSHVGNVAFDGSFADVAVVFSAFFVIGGVDD